MNRLRALVVAVLGSFVRGWRNVTAPAPATKVVDEVTDYDMWASNNPEFFCHQETWGEKEPTMTEIHAADDAVLDRILAEFALTPSAR